MSWGEEHYQRTLLEWEHNDLKIEPSGIYIRPWYVNAVGTEYGLAVQLTDKHPLSLRFR